MNTLQQTWRHVAYGVLEGRADNYPCSRLFSNLLVVLITGNGIAVVLESNVLLRDSYREFFIAFELFSVIIFSIEYVARLWAATEKPHYAGLSPLRARLRYAFSPMALVDLLAIAPFYLALLIPIDLRYLRLFRLLRLLKLSHYFDGLHVFGSVLRREGGAIAGALMIMIVLIVISACLMFTVENAAQPGHFENIAQAIWWAVVTLTTVGYGDITPVTYGGRLLAIVIMLLGVGTMALPAGILAARFSEELQSRREMLRGRVQDALEDGVLENWEHSALDELREELGLSDDDLRRLVATQQRAMHRHNFCPHCGESLSQAD